MIPFVMIVLDELGDGSPERSFTDENQPVEAGFLNCPYEPFRIRIENWGPGRQAERLDTGRSQRVSKRVGEAWIAIMQEEAFPAQASINRIGELPTALDHPGTVRAREGCRQSPPVASRGRSRTGRRSASALQL